MERRVCAGSSSPPPTLVSLLRIESIYVDLREAEISANGHEAGHVEGGENGQSDRHVTADLTPKRENEPIDVGDGPRSKVRANSEQSRENDGVDHRAVRHLQLSIFAQDWPSPSKPGLHLHSRSLPFASQVAGWRRSSEARIRCRTRTRSQSPRRAACSCIVPRHDGSAFGLGVAPCELAFGGAGLAGAFKRPACIRRSALSPRPCTLHEDRSAGRRTLRPAHRSRHCRYELAGKYKPDRSLASKSRAE